MITSVHDQRQSPAAVPPVGKVRIDRDGDAARFQRVAHSQRELRDPRVAEHDVDDLPAHLLDVRLQARDVGARGVADVDEGAPHLAAVVDGDPPADERVLHERVDDQVEARSACVSGVTAKADKADRRSVPSCPFAPRRTTRRARIASRYSSVPSAGMTKISDALGRDRGRVSANRPALRFSALRTAARRRDAGHPVPGGMPRARARWFHLQRDEEART